MKKSIVVLLIICTMALVLFGEKSTAYAANTILTSSQIADHFKSKVGRSAPEASCLSFIADAFAELGATRSSACCAYNYGSSHIVSTSMDNIPVGADVFLNWSSNYSYTRYTCPNCYQYCHHVAVYVGDGYIVHTKSTSSGATVVSKDKLSDVLNYWDMDFRGWGYHGNVTISDIKPYRACIDTPVAGQTYQNDVAVRGWSIYGDGVSKVTCEVNGNTYTCSQYQRTDVADAYPGYPTGKEGFEYAIPGVAFKSGSNTIKVNSYSGSTLVGTQTVTINYTATAVTGVTLSQTSATLTAKGATVTLTANVSPSNATDKSVTWKSSNTAVATVSSSGVVTAVANGTATITATTNSGGKSASCNVTVAIPTTSSDGWTYTTALPSSITTTNYDIQYQNIYQQYATSSPGTGWTDTGVDKQEYTKSGSRYESNVPLQTSDTVRLEEYYYYHYCGPNTAWNDVNYYARDGYVHRDEIHLTNFSVYEHSSGQDIENSNITYYHLKWNDGKGTDAYCHRYSTGGTCDASGGEHAARSPYWYKMYVYQNYTVKNLNLYQKTSEWGTSKDSSATTVKIRYRLKPTSVSLNKTTATLTSKGATVSLTATVAPSNAGCKDVTWKSSNTAVATVSSTGVVTAVGNGTATITVTTASGSKTATCTVTVSIATTGVSLNKTSATLNSAGQTVQLTATVSPSDAANKSVTWKSSNTAVATVSSTGVVTAVGNGTATITVTTASGSKSATCTVTVSIATTGVSLNKTSVTLDSVGETVQLTATVSPSNAANKSVTWKSSNTAVATVDANGLVKAVGNGTTTITVTTVSGSKTATCQIVVKELAIPEFSVANIVGGVQIKWNFVDGATGYIVYRREAGGTFSKIAGFTDGVTKSYVDKTAVNGTTYFYAVKAINNTSQSKYATKGITYKASLATPQFTVASVAGGVQIKWNFVDNATGYIIYRREAGGNFSKIAGFTDGKTKSYIDKNVVDGTAYFYAVKAINGTIQSTYTTKGINYKAMLVTPQFTVANVSGGVQIKWEFVPDATGYIVYRREANGVFQKIAGFTDGKTKSYLDKNVVDGKPYFYAVKAINSKTQSEYTTKGINYKATLATPTFTVANVSGGVQIKWDFVDDAVGYIIYRRDAGGTFSKIAGFTDGKTKSYIDTNVVDGKAYFYAVKAVNHTTQSTYTTKGINYKEK